MEKSKLVITGFLWKFAEKGGAQIVQTIVSIVLARLLMPEVYGVVALIAVIVNILNVFVDSGLGNALIQKKDADDVDFSSVFYFNLGICTLLYVLLFLCAPVIAIFYENSELTAMIRALGVIVLISGIKNIQQAYVSRHMLFKKFFVATLGGTIISAFVGIAMAYMGFGAWALVAQTLTNLSIDTLILWLTVKWRPKKEFSIKRLAELLSFGWKLLVSSLLDNLYNNLRQLIIGKYYSSSDLAYYNRGKQFPELITTSIHGSIDSVLLPVMSSEQDNKSAVKEMMRRAIKVSIYVMAPMMLGLAAVAKPLTCFLLTEKWVDSVLFMQVFCIIYMSYPVRASNLNAIKALGRSDIFLKLEIIKKSVGMALLVVAIPYGVKAIAYSLIVSDLLSQMINARPNRKLLGYGYWEQLKDILPDIIMAVIMAISISAIQLLNLPDIITLLIQVPLGIVIYVLESIITKNETFYNLLGFLKKGKL